eukprot:scaffold292322_cov15-Tisochrysis_lutea.AAC.1
MKGPCPQAAPGSPFYLIWRETPRTAGGPRDAPPSPLSHFLSLPSPLAAMSTPALQDRPVSKTQIFCSNLPWSVNGKMLRQAFE